MGSEMKIVDITSFTKSRRQALIKETAARVAADLEQVNPKHLEEAVELILVTSSGSAKLWPKQKNLPARQHRQGLPIKTAKN